jgi:hypothetical protein
VELGFGFADVKRVDVYTYHFSESPRDVRLTTLTDRREIATWVSYFTDLPTDAASVEADALSGGDADGYRFYLRNGSIFEITHVFIGPNRPGGVSNFLIWPDGTVRKTDYGSPSGYQGTSVVADGWPRAVIGR